MDPLFAPLSFRCGFSAPNRVALAPLTNTQSHEDGTLSEDEFAWLVRRAQGGFGLVSTCAAYVSPDGKAFDGQLGVSDETHFEGLSRLARALSDHGALGVVQLHHGGARALSRLTGTRPWSAVAGPEDPATHPDAAREGTDDEVGASVEAFVRAAELSQRAGFAGVEIHGAHGYLLGQFLSRNNTRSGPWGGALEGRAAMLRAVLRGVRARCGGKFLLGVRLSPEDFGYAVGLDLDESLTVARWAGEDGADFVHASLWDHQKPLVKRPEADGVALFRAAIGPDVRLLVAGRVWTPDEARALLARGADMVALGRAAILDPDWPVHARAPGFVPERGPLDPDQYAARAVGPRFVAYLRRFKGMVAG
jgi:2,4-dienoyl-CoA reductase-like NADH-dependent reductase (Old Yellow Enzyme family)